MLNGVTDIEGLTPEQIEAVNGLASGLVNKNQELLDKLNANKKQANDEESAAEKLKALEAKLEREQLESKQNYQDALKLKEQEYTSTLDKLNNSVSEKDQLIHKLLVENGLQAELSALNVNKDLLPMIQSGLSALATVNDGQAMIGDKSLSEYLKEWAETPAGKASILMPQNNGTGANGGTHNVDSNKKFSDYTGAELSAIRQSKPEEYQRLLETR